MIGSLMMRVSVVILLVGMLAGIVMGIREDFTLQPAHAHLNLVGGVLLFLFGLYYRLVPQAAADRLAAIQGWFHVIGGICFRPVSRSWCWRGRPSLPCRSSVRCWWLEQPHCLR
jgi:hypothetical protein